MLPRQPPISGKVSRYTIVLSRSCFSQCLQWCLTWTMNGCDVTQFHITVDQYSWSLAHCTYTYATWHNTITTYFFLLLLSILSILLSHSAMCASYCSHSCSSCVDGTTPQLCQHPVQYSHGDFTHVHAVIKHGHKYLLMSCNLALSDAFHQPWTKCFMPAEYIRVQCSLRHSDGWTDAQTTPYVESLPFNNVVVVRSFWWLMIQWLHGQTTWSVNTHVPINM